MTSTIDARAPLQPLGAQHFRSVLSHYPTGVAVITAMDGDEPTGFVVGSFSSISLQPALVGFFPDKTSTTFPKVHRTGSFCVNVLGADHAGLCRLFAAKGADRFARTPWRPGPTGSPILTDAVAWIDCTLEATHDLGDHLLAVGRVVELAEGTGAAPLLFHRGRYGTPADITPHRDRNENTMSIVDNARKAGPALAASDADSAQLRRLSDDAWAQLDEIGVLRALQPARWGGGEVSAVDFIDGIVEIGRHSPSAGWVASVVGVHPWQIALFPDRAQQEIWGADPARPIASSYTPTGKIEAVDGGFRVSGRWSFSSGSYHCDGVVLGGICGVREVNGTTYPNFTSVIVDRSDYTIEDTWHTSGLQGTGSNDVVVDGAFVPGYRGQSHLDYTHGLGTPLPGQELNDGALYRLPWAVLFNAIIAAGAVGAALGFLDQWTDETRSRRTNYGGVLRDEAIVQNHLAEATWSLDAAVLKLRRAAVELTQTAEAGAVPSQQDRAFYRWDVTRGAQAAADAIGRLMRVSSGRTAYVDHPLHRRFQDVMAAMGHAFLVADPLGNAFAGRKLGSTNVPEVHL